MSLDSSAAGLVSLVSLRGLRSAPVLNPAQRQPLRAELDRHLAACDWFTVGVMAPTASAAVHTLRALERALGWSPLERDAAAPTPTDADGAVFLKGNQNTGLFQIRAEAGLGSGLLITGHCPADGCVEDTWGPLPLDFFS